MLTRFRIPNNQYLKDRAKSYYLRDDLSKNKL